MNKKEQKRDVAVFAHNLKEMMQDPLPDVLNTLDRDIQNFIYGRIVLLAKHNTAPIGSISDIGAVAGTAIGAIISILVSENNDADSRLVAINNAKESLISGFENNFKVKDDTGIFSESSTTSVDTASADSAAIEQ